MHRRAKIPFFESAAGTGLLYQHMISLLFTASMSRLMQAAHDDNFHVASASDAPLRIPAANQSDGFTAKIFNFCTA
jgi:hypothetical protein